jgi:signal transduction histidine kinase
VHGDAVRLKQVVAHLLANALKFGAPGGTVSVRVVRGPDHAALRVSDSGPGLPDAVLPQLFAAFVQGPNACGGLGVGLAIARRLLTLQGGTIEAIAHGDHGGATFVVTLPLLDA